MSPVWGHVIGVITTLLLLTFVGIWIWAWRKRHQATFKRMAELPMEDPLEGPHAGEPNREDKP